jgi:uncharacterized membrane protein
MQQTLVVVFDDEAKAYGGSHALQGLEGQGDLNLENVAIVVKKRDGTACTFKTWNRHRLAKAITGSIVGGLLGLPAGVPGVAIGLTGGALIGVLGRTSDQEFGKDVGSALTPGSAALIAQVSEESGKALNRRMAALGGTVFRLGRDSIDGFSKSRNKRDTKSDEFSVKLEDAMKRHVARAEARKQARERWIHLLEERAAWEHPWRIEPHEVTTEVAEDDRRNVGRSARQ